MTRLQPCPLHPDHPGRNMHTSGLWHNVWNFPCAIKNTQGTVLCLWGLYPDQNYIMKLKIYIFFSTQEGLGHISLPQVSSFHLCFWSVSYQYSSFKFWHSLQLINYSKNRSMIIYKHPGTQRFNSAHRCILFVSYGFRNLTLSFIPKLLSLVMLTTCPLKIFVFMIYVWQSSFQT